MSSSETERRERRTKKKRASVHYSTPVQKVPTSSSLSVSTIGTDSSPIIITRRLSKQPAKAETGQKAAVASKKQKQANKKKTRKNREKTRRKKPIDTSSDSWRTTQEQSDEEKENQERSVRSPTKELALFADTASPDRIREASHFHDYLIESPLQRRTRYPASSARIDIEDRKISLLPVELSQLQTRFDTCDEEEDDLLLSN